MRISIETLKTCKGPFTSWLIFLDLIYFAFPFLFNVFWNNIHYILALIQPHSSTTIANSKENILVCLLISNMITIIPHPEIDMQMLTYPKEILTFINHISMKQIFLGCVLRENYLDQLLIMIQHERFEPTFYLQAMNVTQEAEF